MATVWHGLVQAPLQRLKRQHIKRHLRSPSCSPSLHIVYDSPSFPSLQLVSRSSRNNEHYDEDLELPPFFCGSGTGMGVFQPYPRVCRCRPHPRKTRVSSSHDSASGSYRRGSSSSHNTSCGGGSRSPSHYTTCRGARSLC